jgi:hypothetical protein
MKLINKPKTLLLKIRKKHLISTTAKPKEIIELQDVYRIELKKLPIVQYNQNHFWKKEKHFVRNTKGEIVAMSLRGSKITEIKSLNQLTSL